MFLWATEGSLPEEYGLRKSLVRVGIPPCQVSGATRIGLLEEEDMDTWVPTTLVRGHSLAASQRSRAGDSSRAGTAQ